MLRSAIRGYIERSEYTPALHLVGWMLVREGHAPSHVGIVINGTPISGVWPVSLDSPLSQNVFDNHLDDSVLYRFDITTSVIDNATGHYPYDVITLQVWEDEDHTLDLDFPVFHDAARSRQIAVPPQTLQVRVHGNMTADFETGGWRIYRDLKQHVVAHRSLSSFSRILDWGCGCGRVARFLIDDVAPERIYGCDIDSEAIDWLTNALPEAHFAAISALPPTAYPDGFFDLIYGISIFTHLDEEMQFAWLQELRRLVSRDGLVAVSVHGQTNLPDEVRPQLDQHGFFDRLSGINHVFAPFAGENYYRETFHTADYILETWTEYYDVIDIVKQGINLHQDLVIMRPKPRIPTTIRRARRNAQHLYHAIVPMPVRLKFRDLRQSIARAILSTNRE
jgi:trans-aconitate methyltransferase